MGRYARILSGSHKGVDSRLSQFQFMALCHHETYHQETLGTAGFHLLPIEREVDDGSMLSAMRFHIHCDL